MSSENIHHPVPRPALAFAVVLAVLLAGCYDGDSSDLREAVVVGRDAITALAIDGEAPVIEVGATLALTARATTGSGTVDLGRDVTWRSSDPAVVVVDRNGNVTGVGNGSAEITAELAQFSDTVTIAASNAALQSIAVSGDATVDECGTGTYSASGHYDDGTDRDITALVAWSVTDSAVARMSTLGTGRNTLVSTLAGTTGVVAARSGIYSPTLTVTVADNLDAIAVTPDTPAQLANGDTLQFIATGSWGAVTGDISRATTWSVANDDTTASLIADIANGDTGPGLLTASNGGTGVVTGSCGGQTDGVDITVVFLDTLAVTNTRPIEVSPNGSVLLVLEGTYSDGTTRPLNETATWSTTLTSGVAVTVSNEVGTRGRVTAGNGTGVSTVTAVVEGKTVSVTVSVQ